MNQVAALTYYSIANRDNLKMLLLKFSVYRISKCH